MSTRLIQHGPGRPAWNMAVDEALLQHATRPVLRFYQWSEPAVSIGYFQSWQEVPTGRSFVRRYTGGGLVDHARDLTFTLVLPRVHPLARVGTSASYQAIHEAVARALRRCGIEAELTRQTGQGLGGSCFQKPVLHDILAQGKKIVGGAQRRSRFGCLHQGSVLLPDFPKQLTEAMCAELVSLLGDPISPEDLTETEQSWAARLETERYSTEAWNRQR